MNIFHAFVGGLIFFSYLFLFSIEFFILLQVPCKIHYGKSNPNLIPITYTPKYCTYQKTACCLHSIYFAFVLPTNVPTLSIICPGNVQKKTDILERFFIYNTWVKKERALIFTNTGSCAKEKNKMLDMGHDCILPAQEKRN